AGLHQFRSHEDHRISRLRRYESSVRGLPYQRCQVSFLDLGWLNLFISQITPVTESEKKQSLAIIRIRICPTLETLYRLNPWRAGIGVQPFAKRAHILISLYLRYSHQWFSQRRQRTWAVGN